MVTSVLFCYSFWGVCLPPPPSPDVVCLQELHCVSEAEVRDWFRSSGFSVLALPGSSRSCGVAIFYKSKLTSVASFFVTLVAASCTVLSLLLMWPLMSLVSMPPTGTWRGTSPMSWMSWVAGTLTRSLIVVWIGLGRIWTTRRVKVSRPWFVSLILVWLWIFGLLCIRQTGRLLGFGPMPLPSPGWI